MDSQHAAHCTSARSAMLAGQVAEAGRHLATAMRVASGDEARAEVLCLRARLAVLQGQVARLLPELTDFAEGAAEPTAAGRVLLDAVVLKLYAGDDDAVACAERARTLLSSADDAARAQADVVLGLAQVFAGRAADAEAMLSRSVDLIRLGGPPDEVAHVLQHVVVGLASRELYDEGAALCRRSVRAVRSVGAVGLLPLMLCYLANTVYFTSDFAEQEMAAAEALDLATAGGQAQVAAYARVCRAVALGLRGEADLARRELEECLVDLEATGAATFRNLTLHGLALIELGAGDWPAAVRGYVRLRANWQRDPAASGVLHWRGDEIEASWRAGDTAGARALLDDLAADAVDYGPWEQAVVARLRALTGDPAEAEERFADALGWHRRSTSRFEQARTELCWGEWLLDQGRPAEARTRLSTAREQFRELDTRAWLRRADLLLGEVGEATAPAEARPRQPTVAGHRITAFGPLTVTNPQGGTVRVALDTPGNLLRLLVVEGGSVRTEHAVDRLWPDTPLAQGGARLRTVLARARRRYGPVVVREGGVLHWSDDVEVDVHRFDALFLRARDEAAGERAALAARAALELYRGDLLTLERYDDAVVVARERLRQRHLVLLDLLAEHERAVGRVHAATDLLRTAIDRDRMDESRYLRLAQLLIGEGQTGPARAVLEQANAAMAELGMPVSARVTALLARC